MFHLYFAKTCLVSSVTEGGLTAGVYAEPVLLK